MGHTIGQVEACRGCAALCHPHEVEEEFCQRCRLDAGEEVSFRDANELEDLSYWMGFRSGRSGSRAFETWTEDGVSYARIVDLDERLDGEMYRLERV